MTFILSYRAMYAALPFVLPFGPVGFVQQPLQQQHEGKWKYAGSYSPLHGIRTCLSETRLQAPIPFVGDVLEIGENQHQRSTVKHYSEPCSGTVPPVWVLLSLAILDHGPKHIHQKTDSFTTFQEKKRGCSLTPYRVNHSKDFIHCMAKEKKFCTLILIFSAIAMTIMCICFYDFMQCHNIYSQLKSFLAEIFLMFPSQFELDKS